MSSMIHNTALSRAFTLLLLGGLLSLTTFISTQRRLHAQEGALEMASLQSIYTQAKELFESPNQPASIPEFKKIIDAFSDRSGRTPEESFLLKKSLEYRARAYFNGGDDTSCAADLRALISIDPAYPINREEVSQKFFNQFDTLRNGLIGTLRVMSTPPGATVSLDGVPIGTTDLIDQPAVAGSHKLRVERKGFEVVNEDIDIQAKQTLTRAYPLSRTAASLSVTTIPSGVEIFLDGQSAGKTPEGESEISRPLVIDGLGLGRHILDFKKSCYEGTTRALAIESIRDLEITTVKLEPSTAALTISSSIPGEAMIDGSTSLGKLPLTDAKVCSGQHTIDVIFAAGKYSQVISPRKDDHITLVAEPRPTLVFLGIATSEQGLEQRAHDREKEVGTALCTVTTLNVVSYGYSEGLQLLRRAGLSPNSFIVIADKSRPDEEKKAFVDGLTRLCTTLKAEAVCLGALSKSRIQEDLFLNFAAPPSAIVESVYMRPVDQDLEQVLAMLNRPFSKERSWIGCRTVDIAGHAGPVILSVTAEGPAAASQLTIGQEIIEAGGAPVSTSVALAHALSEVKPGGRIVLRVRDWKKDAQPRLVEVSVAASPVEIPTTGSDILYTRIIAELILSVKTTGNGLAHFLLGECLARIGDLQSAYVMMQKAQLGGDWGICDGTVSYYKGKILQQLGYKKEAGDAFRQALAFQRATLYDNDGRPVTEAAQRALRDLGP